MTGRVFITGGSGFIGTNLVQHFVDAGCAVSSFDNAPPRNPAHALYWQRGDVCDANGMNTTIAEFRPNVILHAAARTDLRGSTLEDYSANTEGVKNVIAAARRVRNLHRIVFLSSMLVCDLGYMPRHDTDYRPATVYGKSKVYGEELVRAVPTTEMPWVLARPTSIWGPWFGAPYRDFFKAVQRGWFVLPRGCRSVRSYGYVTNLAVQVASLVAAQPVDVLGRVFYLADYVPIELSRWSNSISIACGRGRVREVSLGLLHFAALCGDLAQRLGYSHPPVTSSRLKNLLTSAVFDMSPVANLCPVLPISADEGVRLTLHWLSQDASSESPFSSATAGVARTSPTSRTME